MKGSNGQIVFACGRRYTEVPQEAISQVSVGTKLCVWNNESSPKMPEPKDISCLGCPCKRKAKRKQDMFFHKDDKDPKTDKPHRAPTGIVVQCAIAELIPDTSGK